MQASGPESLPKQLRFAEPQEEQEQVVVQEEEVHPDIFQPVRQSLYTKSCDLLQDRAMAASLDTLERQEQQDIPKVRGDPGKVSAFRDYSKNKNREQNLATLRREVSEYDSRHNVNCQVGDRHFPAHSFVLASGSESLSKQRRFAELQEEQEQVVVQEEEVHPQPVRQFLNTKSCDLFQDGATAASPATHELQEQQDILKVRGDPGEVSGVSNPSQPHNPPTRTRCRVSTCPSRPWRRGTCSGSGCATPS